jgi:hypothetical protein
VGLAAALGLPVLLHLMLTDEPGWSIEANVIKFAEGRRGMSVDCFGE